MNPRRPAPERCGFCREGEQCRRPRDHDPEHLAHIVLIRGQLRLYREHPEKTPEAAS